ncbi:DUF2793 domain-containing protein [Sphingomonas bacterium]|uniref:DUF2793 domain-containing protein n=1 Tax=Sphingomonas bacterium TaxID=1895847 RepID=UPI00157689BD|nr:DUF2793 domain-containing protein [Sphingomonas bacterium]
MTDQTARFALPLIDPGQSQKEMTHNEALALMDAALQPSVRAVGMTIPPTTPAAGDQWIVGPSPSGDWVGQGNAIAAWTSGGWRFVAAVEGMLAWSTADALPVRFSHGNWVLGDVAAARVMVAGLPVIGARRAAIVAPSGGSVIDNETRNAIAAILAAMVGHGLIAAS